jgi:splicing factor 3B subunit 3
MITSLQKTSLVSGAREVVLYTTLMGGIGILIPFASKEDVDLFTTLEMHMRQESPPLSGRDHMAYRSYYKPVKAVVDGDLVEMFLKLKYETKQSIADSLDRTVADISKQIEMIRTRVS